MIIWRFRWNYPLQGRAIKNRAEFVRQLAYQNGYFLSFASIGQDEMIVASVAKLKLDYAPM